jgi:protein involved in polysaccharide export with SLBB domain
MLLVTQRSVGLSIPSQNAFVRRGVLTLMLAVAALFGCAARTDNSRVHLEPPTEQSTLGPGDVFQLQIVGERELPGEYQVASDGSTNLPYIHNVKVEGLEPNEVEELVRERLIEGKILSNPSVVVMVKEYQSKKITVTGQVQKPGSFPFTTGLSLLQVISASGGLTAIANGNRVNLTRTTKGKSRTVVLSVDAIQEGTSPDIPLQAGDRIYVHERIF